jgi:hypothetical protein
LRPNFELHGPVHDETEALKLSQNAIRINNNHATSLISGNVITPALEKHKDRVTTAETSEPAQYHRRRRDTISWPAGRERFAYQSLDRTTMPPNYQDRNNSYSEKRHGKPGSADNGEEVISVPDNRQLACCQINLADLDAALQHFCANFGVRPTTNFKRIRRSQSMREVATSGQLMAEKDPGLDFLHLEATREYSK